MQDKPSASSTTLQKHSCDLQQVPHLADTASDKLWTTNRCHCHCSRRLTRCIKAAIWQESATAEISALNAEVETRMLGMPHRPGLAGALRLLYNSEMPYLDKHQLHVLDLHSICCSCIAAHARTCCVPKPLTLTTLKQSGQATPGHWRCTVPQQLSDLLGGMKREGFQGPALERGAAMVGGIRHLSGIDAAHAPEVPLQQ